MPGAIYTASIITADNRKHYIKINDLQIDIVSISTKIKQGKIIAEQKARQLIVQRGGRIWGSIYIHLLTYLHIYLL